ncbi:PEP-CTERM sorting domain-containing protein [Geomonas anaerohicana]|uniref:PEP-CTERM sorting domain-containing protein n=1 Tax=Geomonas anaerohicana TaxID=2798583 RepID=A0ABS0YC40_9BACT|nr:PEP-CTERM sorting domain-containing protein [Geomonas anaerohicana]MBJ6749872.1 PEP-CTERM sorting domain-containing protein [Geomonas anaerohicana]
MPSKKEISMKLYFSCAIAAMASLATLEARATTLTYNFDQNNSRLMGGPWANITLEDAKDGKVHITVDQLRAGYDSTGPNFGLQDFSFNENTGDPDFLTHVSLEFFYPNTWTYRYSPGSEFGGTGPYGKFELLTSGSGKDWASYLDFYLSSSAGPLSAGAFAVTSPNTEYMFAGQIGGFSDVGADGKTYRSAQFASSGRPVPPVPEPGTVALLGTGCFALAVYAKRRKAA